MALVYCLNRPTHFNFKRAAVRIFVKEFRLVKYHKLMY